MDHRLATIDISRKLGGCCAPFLAGAGELGPHLTQCGLGRGLPLYQVTSWSIQLFGHNTPTSQTDRQTRQDRPNRQDNGPIAYGEPFYNWVAQK